MSAKTNPYKAFQSRLNTVLKNTEDFDAPAPPRPPPAQVPYPFSRDVPLNPLGFVWAELVPDLAVLDGIVLPGADLSGLRLVSRLELNLMRRASRSFLRRYALPVGSGAFLTVRVDSRRRFSAVSCPDSIDYAYLTTAPYPEWLADESSRNAALAELAIREAGLD